MGILRCFGTGDGTFEGPATCTAVEPAAWALRQPPRLLREIQEHSLKIDAVRLRPLRQQMASFLKVPTSFEDDEDDASKAADDEIPRPPDSPLNNLAKFRSKHARTQDGYLCAAAGVKDEQAFTGCTDLPAPDGTNIGRKWCYIEPAQVETAGKEWGWCRAWTGWPDIVDGVELPA
ncbi:hypothetical protein AK812_SmicGene12057 [Symbiodinium microadriaticum]|uniref:Uncharacterized protein n=1 Tax=Symbiodinium microadriaticum TaxID=2951 RepID=A0A1Q9EBM6_SYMMI|nr:hypothetical protein AK812_SmicGene12057 [Symbiodinium microadriaticum]CAE7434312.1 unnamed protein product [Symbiodinium microadriaticum]CAE7566919.1 unnamed protein product [Symbiodinium sp. KB8]